jgi:acyl transferase domain-containing protein/NAD(P)-dependent dehydrogenase (short-subunit alcohol dehydrogenase family)/acyl carrier protein
MNETAHRAIAIVGAGAILPDAPNVAAFWKNVTDGRYSITDVSPDRWDPNLYFDPDPKAPDKTYSKIGGWVREATWDPPLVSAAMDEGQKWAIACVREALQDFGYPERPLNTERTAVILGNAMAGEKHYLTALRVFYPDIARFLETAPQFAALPPDARREILTQFHANLGEALPPITEDTMPGELSNCIAGRIANLFNFHGPNYVVDAACASAMAAITAAVEGLVEGDYDAVLTGGIDRNMGPSSFVKFCKIGALSATGTRPYADGADGFVMGEGAAVFLLKRLADAERDGDPVYAVIRGIGGASDGRGKGITAPNPVGQRLAIERGWKNAHLSPATAGLIEGHGTSTRVGDVVEVESLAAIFGQAEARPGSIALGSVKSNIGHLKSAAGAAGILKAALALRDKVLPPSLNFHRPNPNLDFGNLPFRVNTECRAWETKEGTPRRAGVSAFGFGGTNFHVVLEEHVHGALKNLRAYTISAELDVTVNGDHGEDGVSVKLETAGVTVKAPLRGALLVGGATVTELADKLKNVQTDAAAGNAPPPAPPAKADLAAPERVSIDYDDAAELADKAAKAIQALESDAPAKWRMLRSKGVFRGSGAPAKVAFLYTGQGSQYVNMLHELRDADPIVAAAFTEADECSSKLLPKPLTHFIFADAGDPAAMARAEEDLRQTAITQPAVLTVDYALTNLLAAYGVRPDMVMGHSLGEYGALVASGAFTFDHALEAVSARGREMTKVSVADNGLMAAVMAPPDEIEKILKTVDGYVVVANYNSRKQAVIGGASPAVEAAMEACKAAGFNVIKLSVSHAFHTSIVAPASEPLKQQLTRLTLAPPRVPIISNVTGEFYPSKGDVQADMLDLLGKQVASPVQFVKGLHTLYDAGVRIFVEVGPKRALHGFVEDVFDGQPDVVALSTNHPKLGDVVSFNHALCGLYAAGIGQPVIDLAPEKPEPREIKTSIAPVSLNAPTEQGRFTMPAPVTPPPVTPAAGEDVFNRLGHLFADFLDRGMAVYRGESRSGPPASGSPVAITGAALGLPGTEKVFDDGNVARILHGEQLIDVIPARAREAIRDKHITRLVKNDAGGSFETIDDVADVVKLAGRAGKLDLAAEFGIPEDRIPAYDGFTRLAIAAGLDALRDAGIPLAMHYKTTTKGTQLPDRWGLPDALRDDTGIIFASAFPGLDAFADDLNHFHADRTVHEKLELLDHLKARANGDGTLRLEIERLEKELADELARHPFTFDRRFLFRVLAMGHSQFAELIGARGPNTQINSACASTTQAVSLAEDWIRLGRARRVIIVAADDITSDTLLEWFGAGFLATGAAATDEDVKAAALPFDRRRHGMILGMGAVAIVLESRDAVAERGLSPICEVLSTVTANSAFHGTRLDVSHISRMMENLVATAEARHGIRRSDIASKMVFVSHETYTPARGGSASAEIHALRDVFGTDADRIVIANTKGFTGHAMGAGIEDVVAIKALETGLVPPVANFKEIDPELGQLNLSKGGIYPIEFALRLGAGFGSQISLTLLRRVPAPDGARRQPNELGFVYRVADRARWENWLRATTGQADPALEVVHRTLRVADTGHATIQKTPEVKPAQSVPVSPAPVVAPVAPVVQAAPVTAPLVPPVTASTGPLVATPSGQFRSPFIGDEIRDRVVMLVSEKTGYPTDMLALDLDLEADLGVDTVKQAELFAGIREEFRIPRDENLKLRDYPTLSHVIKFVKERLPAPGTIKPTPTSLPVLVEPENEVVDVKDRVLALVAEKTGYPIEMLDLELDLEADLGIDTVKQAELFAAVRAEYGIARDENLKLREFPTLGHVLQFVNDRRERPAVSAGLTISGTVQTFSTPEPPPPTGSSEASETDAVQKRVLELVSEKTGYPVEMLDLELDLEADLGVDTVKQAELFAAVRGEYGIARDETLKLRDFPTLAHVIQFVYDRRPAPTENLATAPETGPVTADAAPPEPVEHIELPPGLRREPVAVVRPGFLMCPPSLIELGQGRRVVIGFDESGVGEALEARLVEQGVEVLSLDLGAPTLAVTELVADWKKEGPIHGVYWLPALDSSPEIADLTPESWAERLRRRVKTLHGVMRTLYDDIVGPHTFLISAVRLGGRHGYDAGGAREPLGGAVTGFTKAYHRERPDALVKAVDFEFAASPSRIAETLLAETLSDPFVTEVGHFDDLRWTVGLRDVPETETRDGLKLDENTVFVVTGAAGSIVSAITADLAKHGGGTFYLLDRVPTPDPLNPDLERFKTDRDGLKRDIFERLKATVDRPTPALVERELAALERSVAALDAIRAVEDAGGTATYLSVDLLDAKAVAGAIEIVRTRHGRIDALIHAAGLEISRFLCDKSAEEFDLVFDVKANGFHHLLHAAGDMPIGAVVAFSSIAGRFGNGGQTDYSAANDLLCKQLSNFKTTRPETVGIAIDWTAWSGIGMASRGSIPKMMELAGIDMLAPEHGIPLVRKALTEGGGTRELVVAGRLGLLMHEKSGEDVDGILVGAIGPMIHNRIRATVYDGISVTTTLDPTEQPFLDHHRIDGTAVLPGVMGVEAFCKLARTVLPDRFVASVEDVTFLAPFKFYRDEPREVTITATFHGEGENIVAECRLTGTRTLPNQPEPRTDVHFTAKVRMSRFAPTAEPKETPEPLTAEMGVGREDIYALYFHGPAYRVLERATRHNGAFIGHFAKGLPANHQPARAKTASAPRLLELCFQTAGIAEMQATHRMGLPMAVDRVVFHCPFDGCTGESFQARVTPSEEHEGAFDAVVLDHNGGVRLVMRGYRTAQLPDPVAVERLAALEVALV